MGSNRKTLIDQNMGGLVSVASLVAKLLEGLEPRCPMLADKPVNSVCLSVCLSLQPGGCGSDHSTTPSMLCYTMLARYKLWPCVCRKLEFYRNGVTDRADFGLGGFRPPILRYVLRKFGYLQK